MNELTNFVKMSKYAGERFDLIQAGGGNTSVKFDSGSMLIKASGFLLSDVEMEKGYVEVNNNKVISILEDPKLLDFGDKKTREKYAADLLKDAMNENSLRPSIETFLHSMLHKYTLHTHPLVVNAITCKEDWKDILMTLFSDALFVNYHTPGIDLALELNKEYKLFISNNQNKPKVIFLQNHGLIISSDDYDEIEILNEKILRILESYLSVDLNKYKLTNNISSLVNSVNNTNLVSYLSTDIDLYKHINKSILTTHPFCPDGYVFCGVRVVGITDLTDTTPIINYYNDYRELPKIIWYNNFFYIIAQNIRKAKEIEDVYKFHVMTIDMAKEDISYLSMEELKYLGNWDSEKYRQKI